MGGLFWWGCGGNTWWCNMVKISSRGLNIGDLTSLFFILYNWKSLSGDTRKLQAPVHQSSGPAVYLIQDLDWESQTFGKTLRLKKIIKVQNTSWLQTIWNITMSRYCIFIVQIKTRQTGVWLKSLRRNTMTICQTSCGTLSLIVGHCQSAAGISVLKCLEV